jgi:hypothetical protein
MPNLKNVLRIISVAVLFVSLGVWFAAARTVDAEPQNAPVHEPQCLARAAEAMLTLQAPVESSRNGSEAGATGIVCGPGEAVTCCPCDHHCGCRPQHISPANWCAC